MFFELEQQDHLSSLQLIELILQHHLESEILNCYYSLQQYLRRLM